MSELMQKIMSDEALHQSIMTKLSGYRHKISSFRGGSWRGGEEHGTARGSLWDMWNVGYELYKNLENTSGEKEDWEADVLIPYIHQYIKVWTYLDRRGVHVHLIVHISKTY